MPDLRITVTIPESPDQDEIRETVLGRLEDTADLHRDAFDWREVAVRDVNAPGWYVEVVEHVSYTIPVDVPDEHAGLTPEQLATLYHSWVVGGDDEPDAGVFADSVIDQVVDRVGDHYVQSVDEREVVRFVRHTPDTR